MQILLPDEHGIAAALHILRAGGVVAHATETCYGLACDLTNPKAVEKLFAIKQRPQSQLVSGLFGSIEDAQQYVEWNDRAEELAKEHLPGPLTLILPIKENWIGKIFSTPLDASIPRPLPPEEEGGARIQEVKEKASYAEEKNKNNKHSPPPSEEGLGVEAVGDRGGEGNTLGIRISSHPLAQALVQLFGKPLTTTSANLHGKENPYSPEDIQTQFANAPLKPDLILDSGLLPQNPPSTVINLADPSAEILRKGSIQPTKRSL